MEVLNFLFPVIKLGLIMAIMTLGVHISYRILDMADLSIEGVFPLGAVVAILLIYVGVNPFLATLISFVCGLIAGFITAIMHTKLKIPMILSGIITMTGLYSLNLLILGLSKAEVLTMPTLALTSGNVTVFTKIQTWFQSFISNPYIANNVASIIICLLFLLLVYILIYYFFGTQLGMAIRSTGDNKKMSKSIGINTDLMIIIGLMLSNGLIALSGALFAQNSTSANVVSGRGMIVVGLASIIVGEVIFGRKTYKSQLISIVIGTIIYYSLRQLAIIIGILELLDLVSAILIVILLSLPLIKKQFKGKKEVIYARN